MNFFEGQAKLSVIMVGHRRADLLRRAINSLLQFTKRTDWELILVLNGTDPALEKLASDFERARIFPLQVLRISECRPGAARNHGIRAARGDVLFFLDDDIEIFQDILSAAIKLFEDPNLMAAGGANLTPPGSGAFERATGLAMASFWGTAGMRWRYRSCERARPANEHALILCNLAVRRALFFSTNIGAFPSHLVSNEENFFLQRLEAKGAKMLATPSLAVYHLRRNTWRGLAQQTFKYGKGRAQNCLCLPESFRFFYLLPSVLFLYFATLPFMAPLLPMLAIPAALYFFIGLIFASLDFWKQGDLSAFLLQPLCYLIVHISYGLGFASGVLQWAWRRGRLCEI